MTGMRARSSLIKRICVSHGGKAGVRAAEGGLSGYLEQSITFMNWRIHHKSPNFRRSRKVRKCKVSRTTELEMENVDSSGHWKSLYEVLAVWFGAKPILFMRVTQDWA